MYGKIFESMYHGTLAGNWKALITFQQMIVLSNDEGIIDMTPHAISNITGIPLEIIEEGIKYLEQPDIYSRTPDHEGRRIERLDEHRPWGWIVLNKVKYKRLASREEKKAADRERLAAKRNAEKPNKINNVAACRTVSPHVADVAHTDTDTDTKERVRAPKKKKTTLPPEFSISESIKDWAVKKGHTRLADHLEAFVEKCTAHNYQYVDWDAAFKTAVRQDWAGLNNKKERADNYNNNVKALANKLGMTAKPGESWEQFGIRVRRENEARLRP